MGRKNQLSRQSRSRTSFAASLGAAPLKGGAAMSAYQGASHTDLALSDWQPMAGSADADLLPELHSDNELALDNRHDDAAITSAQLPVHHDDIAVIDAVFLHGRAGHAQQERGLGVRDQQVSNIQPLASEVIRGRACACAAISQRQSNRGRDQLDGHTTHKTMTVHMYSVAVDATPVS